tara:strand:+ start:9141 stop:10286 length:1146 start_codon:yes stop_codon:yes gene_type:complete
MRKEVNIWDLGNRINIKINPSFIKFINNKIKEKFKSKRKIHNILNKHYKIPFSTFKDRMKIGYKYFIDLEILLNLCKILQIPLKNLQKNIISYKTRGGNNYIKNPKLPIKITPLFDMLIAHHIGDGCVVNPKNGRKPYFSYRQYNKFYRDLYIKKIESVFGQLKYESNYLKDKKTTQVYFPLAVSELMFKIYNLNINSFKTEISRIPKQILEKNKQYKLAVLIAFIIDEGNIDSNLILIRLKNKELIEDLQIICNDFNYDTTLRKTKDGMFNLYILSKSISKFYKDYLNLLNKYSEVNLGYKGQKIEEFINRLNKPKRYIKGNKNKILNLLSKKQLTVNELANTLNMTRQGARYLIKKLLKENKIEIKLIVKYGNYKYGLI